jgi:hypothetical protein
MTTYPFLSLSAFFSSVNCHVAQHYGQNLPQSKEKVACQASGVMDLRGRSYKDVLADSLEDKYRL